MNFGFGIQEFILIAMMVLIVFGPRRLPEITRMLGKGIREFRKGMNEIQRELEAAGRETQWQSPPAPPKPAGETIAGTVAAAGATPAEGSAAASEEEKAEGAATDDAATDGEEQAAAPVLEEQAPPVPRDAEDPAAEFIDPWSTDSSRPNFGQPRPEPVIAPPTPAATAPAERSAEAPSEAPTEPPAEASSGKSEEEAPAD